MGVREKRLDRGLVGVRWALERRGYIGARCDRIVDRGTHLRYGLDGR